MASIFVYANVDECIYALLTNLFHSDTWVYFTNYYTQGQRIVTTSQPGSLQLEPLKNNTDFDDLFIQNAGSSALESQWKRHRRLAATWLPNENSLLLQPEQHLSVERGFYLRYVDYLLQGNILRQSDTQTFRFTRSGARAFHAGITSKSARRPQPKVEEWIGQRGKLPVKSIVRNRSAMIGVGIAASVAAAAVIVIPTHQYGPLTESGNLIQSLQREPGGLAAKDTVSPGNNQEALDDASLALATGNLAAVPPISARPGSNELATPPTSSNRIKQLEQRQSVAQPADESPQQTPQRTTGEPKNDTVHLIAASTEDEMWRIAVENAEFYLMSNDGDPAPWIRTARKIAAGFRSDDSRLARTYFLAALLESDYRIAEQQYNRALSIQTKALGLYHPETAQTLEALAWIAERNKDSLEEAITHQKLALNIYRDIYGAEAEDTKAATWKLEYFENRLAGNQPRIDENRRLLPALARFSN